MAKKAKAKGKGACKKWSKTGKKRCLKRAAPKRRKKRR